MAERQSTVEKAIAARESGGLWRAKEILIGRLRSGDFDPAVHEELGRTLLEMKDTLEAGRHLYVSGSSGEDAEAASAIALFLSRHGRSTAQSLHMSFPAPARRSDFENLPERVREDLLERGLVPPPPSRDRAPRSRGRKGDGDYPGLLPALFVLAAFFLLVGLGIFTAFEMVCDWLE